MQKVTFKRGTAMKKVFVTASIFLFVFMFYSNVYAFTCSIVDEWGNTITEAKAGDLVYLKDSYVNLKSGKMKWKLQATLPTIDSKNYKMLIKNSGYYYHDGSDQEYNNFIPIAIPAFDYIIGTATITYSLSKAGNCTIPLYISEYVEPLNAYTITATAGPNGSITPSGIITVAQGQTQIFTITPNAGYHIADVVVDGTSVGAVSAHTFADITSNHTIHATFTTNVSVSHIITATAGANGSIAPSGAVTVSHGQSQTFTITPNTGYHIADVIVDGASIGAVTSHIFAGVTSDHTIHATFAINVSNGKTWNVTADYYGDILDISITSDPTNRTFNLSFTGVTGDPFTCYGWTFVQGGNQFEVSKSSGSVDEDTALLTPLGGWDACSNIYPGVTKSAVISQIPSWFDFNAQFTFVFDSHNSFLLSP